MQIPCRGRKARDDVPWQSRDVPSGRAQIGDDLGDGQPLDGVGDVGERGDQEQAHHVLRVFTAAQVGVDGFGDGGAAGRDIVRDGVSQRVVDLVDLREGFAALQVDVMGGDKVRGTVGLPDP